jgi:hypothetical protein
MTYTFFTTSDSDEDEEYSSFVDLEDFEEEEEPQGFEGTKKGSELNSTSPDSGGPVPWDPSESFFAYL